ncbi:MAG: hypothetical protein J0L85_18430, partial [Zoogloea sp.]|nr:hypothetical protein [Zoogloea sp.]
SATIAASRSCSCSRVIASIAGVGVTATVGAGVRVGADVTVGGAARNDLLMQIQADLLGVPVIRPRQTETTALGAACLAGLAVGVWDSPDTLASHWQAERVFEPSRPAGWRAERLATWHRAVERCRGWTQE